MLLILQYRMCVFFSVVVFVGVFSSFYSDVWMCEHIDKRLLQTMQQLRDYPLAINLLQRRRDGVRIRSEQRSGSEQLMFGLGPESPFASLWLSHVLVDLCMSLPPWPKGHDAVTVATEAATFSHDNEDDIEALLRHHALLLLADDESASNVDEKVASSASTSDNVLPINPSILAMMPVSSAELPELAPHHIKRNQDLLPVLIHALIDAGADVCIC
jgi:hypothetical protein